ncbi:MAG: DUF896 domain-containing protein [Oscillospiraceae bacterium]|nr:DUF896 domain-containing protein [Oscillospiraceae bacterium]MDD5913416.1 DUF896 domain-containing protein [Oscillospiraceae bacterium]MDD5964194.1 DUF896 domain-containing protein [Oscillospiraceae bacterium]
MTKEKIARINELARKMKAEGLSEAEKTEQAQLRREYVAAVVGDLKNQLDNTYVIDEKGNKIKVADANRKARTRQ